MKIYLAAPSSRPFLKDEFYKCKYFLESFYSMQDWLIPELVDNKDFMLDSGAFTFMTSKDGGTDFDEYLDRYIDFINRYEIDLFFELDVDNVIGLKGVEKLRARLEAKTGKRSIPVFHKSRGKEYFLGMCKDYEYIAIGGIASKEIKPNEYKYFRWFIDKAHENNCKIHGLGFTNLRGLYNFDFDSVDSTAWTSGGRFGTLYHFDGFTLSMADTRKIKRKSEIGTNPINRHNYLEWLKFQAYADIHL